MSRTPEPRRIAAAKRAGIRARLTSLVSLPARADELLEAWELEAGIRDLHEDDATYWDEAWRWLEQRVGV